MRGTRDPYGPVFKFCEMSESIWPVASPSRRPKYFRKILSDSSLSRPKVLLASNGSDYLLDRRGPDMLPEE